MSLLLTSDSLKKLVTDDKKPAIVLFTGDWCPDCRAFGPTWDSWVKRHRDLASQVNVHRDGDEWDYWKLDEIPTVSAFSEGREIDRVHGNISESDVDGLLKLI